MNEEFIPDGTLVQTVQLNGETVSGYSQRCWWVLTGEYYLINMTRAITPPREHGRRGRPKRSIYPDTRLDCDAACNGMYRRELLTIL